MLLMSDYRDVSIPPKNLLKILSQLGSRVELDEGSPFLQ